MFPGPTGELWEVEFVGASCRHDRPIGAFDDGSIARGDWTGVGTDKGFGYEV